MERSWERRNGSQARPTRGVGGAGALSSRCGRRATDPTASAAPKSIVGRRRAPGRARCRIWGARRAPRASLATGRARGRSRRARGPAAAAQAVGDSCDTTHGSHLRQRKMRKPATSTVSAVRMPQEKHCRNTAAATRQRLLSRCTALGRQASACAPSRTSLPRSRCRRPPPAPPWRRTRFQAEQAAAAGALPVAPHCPGTLPPPSRSGARRGGRAPAACMPRAPAPAARTRRCAPAAPRSATAPQLVPRLASRAPASRTRPGCSCAAARDRRAPALSSRPAWPRTACDVWARPPATALFAAARAVLTC